MNLHMRKTEKSSWKKRLEKHNEILIRIQFILEVSVYRQRLWNKNFKLYGPVLWTKLACFKIMCCFWAVDYFHCYLNQMPKQLIHSSYILKTKKDWEYWLNYSVDLSIELFETFDALNSKLFSKHWILHVFLLVIIAWKKIFCLSILSHILDPLGLVWSATWCYSMKHFYVTGVVCVRS